MRRDVRRRVFVGCIGAWLAAAGAPARAEPPVPSDCRATPDKAAAPGEVALGAAVTVTLAIDVACDAEPLPLNVVLVIDRSGSMGGGPLEDAKRAAGVFLEAVDFRRTRVGVVSFARTASVDAHLSSDARRLGAEIAGLVAGGDTHISEALRIAGRVLGGIDRPPDVAQAIVLMTDGRDLVGPAAVRQQAAQQKSLGAHVVTIGLGPQVDHDLLRDVASTPDDYFFAPTSTRLPEIYAGIAGRLGAIHARDVVVSDVLPDDMALVAGSIRPPAVVAGRTLTWSFPALPVGGVRVAYQVVPTRVGRRPTNVAADASFVDALGRWGRAVFPVPEVVVRVPTTATPPEGTPSPTGPRATADTPPPPSPFPTLPSTPAATATPATATAPPGTGTPPPGAPAPTPRDGSRPFSVWLPRVEVGTCRRAPWPLDAVIVLDTSTTMLAPTGGGGTKLDAARAAIRAFLAGLDSERVRAAIVAFDGDARIVAPLGADPAAAGAALDAVSVSIGSRIDRGLVAAGEVLAAPRRPGALGNVILVSDGRPVGVSPDAVRAIGSRLRAAGHRVYTVGLGPGADDALLRDVAGDPARHHDAGSGERLAEAMRDVAGGLECR